MEQSSLLYTRKSLLLERILLCATSALASALATLSLARFLRKRSTKGHQVARAEAYQEAKEWHEKQLLAALAKVKELEASLSFLETEKDALGSEFSRAAEKLAAAAKVESELKHELGKVRFAAREVQDAYNSISKEKEAALASARQLQREKENLEKAVADAKANASGMQRSLTALTNEKKAAERRAKQLETDIHSAQAAKARSDSDCIRNIQELEKKLARAESARQAAERDLAEYNVRLAPLKEEVATFKKGRAAQADRERKIELALEQSRRQLGAEGQRRAALEPQLLASQRRVRELEASLTWPFSQYAWFRQLQQVVAVKQAELRITREAARSSLKRSSSRGSVESQRSTHSGF